MRIEINFEGNSVALYTVGADLVSQERSGRTSIYLYDGHGSVVGLTDESGKVTDTYVYDAFGNFLKSKGNTVNCYRYCGEQFDETTGLYYLRARYMDTTTGRFISQDSYQGNINDPVSLHKYLYANSNPVMYIDPSGNTFIEAIGSAISFGISTVAESQYNKAIVAMGLVLLTELVYLSATHESLILTSLQSYWELTDKCILGLITWCSANISIAADKIMRVKDEEAANEIDKLKKQYPKCTIIYRKGSGTYTNLTPREKDIEGLSYQLTMPIFTPYTFTAIELIEKTATLEAKVDGVDHVSVYPTYMFTMQQWIDSRSDAENNPHPYSVLLRSISVRVG